MHRTKELLQKLDEKIKFHLSEFNKLKSINEKLKLKNDQLLESNLTIQNRLNEIEKNFKALKPLLAHTDAPTFIEDAKTAIKP